MKLFLKIIKYYIIIAGLLLVSVSMPMKAEDLEAKIQAKINYTTQNFKENRFASTMTEEQQNAYLASEEQDIRQYYTNSNSFSTRLKENCRPYFIGLIIISIMTFFLFLHSGMLSARIFS